MGKYFNIIYIIINKYCLGFYYAREVGKDVLRLDKPLNYMLDGTEDLLKVK